MMVSARVRAFSTAVLLPMTHDLSVLIALPDPAQAQAIAAGLCAAQANVHATVLQGCGADLQVSGARPPRWAFIDWLLPDMSGLELCRRLREAEPTRRAHLTLVLDDADADLRRRALAAGADDYMSGPLTAEAILARIGTPGHPAPAGRTRRLKHGDLTIDLAAFQVRFHERPLPLRPNEFRVLAHFVENPDQVFSRASLIRHLGKDDATVDERTVDVWIGRLRRSLRAQGVPDPLRTVRSLGYVLDSLPE